MAYGIFSTGFIRPTFDDLYQEALIEVREEVSATFEIEPKDPVGAALLTSINQRSKAWQALYHAYHAHDPDNADEAAQVAQSKLLGVFRLGPRRGLVVQTVVFAGPFPRGPYAAETLTAHVDGQPDNLWGNRDEVTITQASQDVTFWSLEEGPEAIALAGQLTQISQPIDGWQSTTNVSDAVQGRGIETIEELKLRRFQALGRLGSASGIGIKADVGAVDNVIAVKVYGPLSVHAAELGILSGELMVMVWDGVVPAANNDQIAQAMIETIAEGSITLGDQTGTAIDANEDLIDLNFRRATQKPIAVQIELIAKPNTTIIEDDVVEALLSAIPPDVIDGKVRLQDFMCKLVHMTAIDEIVSLTFGLASEGTPTSDASITAGYDGIFTISASDVEVL